ncbi:MAG: helix-turn-helix domain-containing protein [bacterium]|nr:helix-turn-helix domain-containing protein [bacterium]
MRLEIKIRELLSQLEGRMLEFKEYLPSGRQLAKTVIAFANGSGGKIIIGVKDKPREIIGVKSEDLFLLEESISSIIYDSCGPLIVPHIRIEQIEDKSLLIITIYPGNDKPYYLKGTGREKGVYVRVGSSNRVADLPTIQELERQRLNISYDSTPLFRASPGDLDNSSIEEYLTLREEVRGIPKELFSKRLLLKLRLAREEGEEIFPTVGGILLFGKAPLDYFPYGKIKCARFKGQEMEEFIDQQEIFGRLKDQVEEAMKFFKRNVRRGAKIKGLYREERYEYPEIAIREAIINAVVHRDYSMPGSDIKFAIFDDRIEITSPGVLPIGISLEDLGTGSSEIRNRVMAKIFRDIGLIEEWGRGIRIMREKMKDWGLKLPLFKEEGNYFKVIFFGEEKSNRIPEEESVKILEFIQREGKIENKDVQEILGVHRNTALNKLRAIVASGKIEQRKNGKMSCYVMA